MNGQVSDLEDRLREAYRGAADTVSPDGVPTLDERMSVIGRRTAPGGAGRRAIGGRVLVPLAAAAAIVAIAAGLPALLSGRPSAAPRAEGGAGPASATATASPSPPPTLHASPGPPPFFAAISGGADTSVSVYRATTATLAATVAGPHPGDNFYAIAATADPLEYLVAVGHPFSCGTRLYELRLTPGGRLAGYTPLSVPAIPEDILSLAVTPDGTKLGYAGQYCSGPDNGTGDIGFVNLAAKTVSRWTAPGNEDIGSLSVSRNGSQIGFVIQQTQLYQPEAGVLATDSPAGPLARRAQIIVSQEDLVTGSQVVASGTVPDAAALGPDGRVMYVCGVAHSGTPDTLLTFSGSVMTGSLDLAGWGPCALSLDPSGRFLLVQISTGSPRGGTIEVINVTTGEVMTVQYARGIGPQQGVWGVW